MIYQSYRIKLDVDKDNNLKINLQADNNRIGYYDIVNNNTNYQASQTRIIKGKTKSRLSEVETYNQNQKYVVGVNGVIEVSNDLVKYNINGITYTTNLNTQETYFEYVNNYENQDLSGNLLVDEDTLGLIEKPYNSRNITVNRNFISGIDSVVRILNLKSIPEIEDYGNNYFKIFKK